MGAGVSISKWNRQAHECIATVLKGTMHAALQGIEMQLAQQ